MRGSRPDRLSTYRFGILRQDASSLPATIHYLLSPHERDRAWGNVKIARQTVTHCDGEMPITWIPCLS